MRNYVTFLVHGINCGDRGSDTVMQTATHIARYSEIRNHAYGRIGPIGAIFKNKKIAKGLARCSKKSRSAGKTVFAIGHSNGCAIIVQAMRQGAKFKSVLLINPALNVNCDFPPGDYSVTVIHTKHDKAVRAARFFDAVPFFEFAIPDIWGAMGAVGYRGHDRRVENLDWSDLLKGHSHIFDPEIMDMVGTILAMNLYVDVISA